MYSNLSEVWVKNDDNNESLTLIKKNDEKKSAKIKNKCNILFSNDYESVDDKYITTNDCIDTDIGTEINTDSIMEPIINNKKNKVQTQVVPVPVSMKSLDKIMERIINKKLKKNKIKEHFDYDHSDHDDIMNNTTGKSKCNSCLKCNTTDTSNFLKINYKSKEFIMYLLIILFVIFIIIILVKK
jgi:hypothetical protein